MAKGNDRNRFEGETSDRRMLVAASRDLGFVVDETGQIRYSSPSVERTLGHDRASLEGTDVFEHLHPDDRDDARNRFDAVVTGADTSNRFRHRLECADGSYVWFESIVSGPPAADSDAIDRYVIDAREESRRSRTDRTEGERTAFATTLAQLHDATARLYSSESVDECLHSVIDAAVNVLGFDWCILAAPAPDEDVFQMEAVSDGAPIEVGERTLSVDEGIMGHAYQTGESTVTADTESSGRGKPTHDSIRSALTIPVGDWGVFQALSITPGTFDEDDLKLAEILVTPMATTIERIEGERELERRAGELEHQYDRIESLHAVATQMKTVSTREAVYDLVIEAAEEILEFDICILDEVEGDVLVPKAVASDMSMEDYYSETPLDKEDSSGAEAFRKGETVVVDDLQASGRTPAQSRYLSALSVPLDDWGLFQAAAERTRAFDETDRRLTELLIEHAAAAIERIEHERELERRAEALERQNERLDRFTSLVSHDLRTPLSVATGYLEMAREPGTEGGTDDPLDEVGAALERMEALIGDMLTLAREGSAVVEPEPVDVAALARGRWAAFDPPDAALVIDDGDDALTISADESRLGQVFENLFRNALEHAGDDVTVRVGLLADGTGFYVADDGPGIPPAERSTVMELGHTGADGTGLGLAIVGEIASAHGWDVSLAESRDGGARFEFAGVDVPDEREASDGR